MNYPLSGSDILKFLKGRTNIVLYSDLINAESIDELLYPYGSCVILYEEIPSVGHWVAITKNGDAIEFFDSYGGYPDDMLVKYDKDIRLQLNEDYPYLSQLMLDSPYELHYNQYKLQGKGGNIATCGRWAMARILYKDTPLDVFVKKFLNKKKKPDQIVLELTNNI